ncbi:MAG: hypothetical protein ABRQ39_18810 [Candidatus Eremiobacterota bacterium]
MKAGEVDQGQVIKDLLFDIKSLKQEDILTDKHKKMLAEAEGLLLEAQKFHQRYLPAKATADAKQRSRIDKAIVTRFQRDAADTAYKRDTYKSKAEAILGDLMAEIEKMAGE